MLTILVFKGLLTNQFLNIQLMFVLDSLILMLEIGLSGPLIDHFEESKESIEAEMEKLKVQKLSSGGKQKNATAAVLFGGFEMNGQFSERCLSMEKHYAGRFVRSPRLADDSG
ncbi:Uncharacterized protein Rs2_03725 [Raphanus sativus]|nr:Uncharacterized protein Rs2_03725 [Raphanus sativus]